MALSPDQSLVRYDSALALRAGGAASIFCSTPSVLEAINLVLRGRGLPLLWSHSDGTIGAADPLLLRMEYSPSPFVN